MARTPLMRTLQRLMSEHRKASETGRALDEIRESALIRREEAGRRRHDEPAPVSRRRCLAVGGAAIAGGVLSVKFGRLAFAAAQPRIVIVGGGLAGLTTALTLQDGGYASTVYEALDRIGGRTRSDGQARVPTSQSSAPGCGSCHTVTRAVEPVWADGQVTDVFGELIDTNHTTMLALAERFRLPLIDLLASEPAGATETYYFLGSHYPKADADRDFAALYPVVRADLREAGYPTTRVRERGRV